MRRAVPAAVALGRQCAHRLAVRPPAPAVSVVNSSISQVNINCSQRWHSSKTGNEEAMAAFMRQIQEQGGTGDAVPGTVAENGEAEEEWKGEENAPLSPENAVLFICDIQSVFAQRISAWRSVVHVAQTLIRASKHMDIPVLSTEQYPQGLGTLVEPVTRVLAELKSGQHYHFHKTQFSMCTEDVMWAMATDVQRQHVILTGIEAHVCVLQTALDLINIGHTVHIVADGVSSQRPADRMIALQRLRDAGAIVTTSESIAFQLMRDAKHPAFKDISKLYRAGRPDPKLALVDGTDSVKYLEDVNEVERWDQLGGAANGAKKE